MPTQRCPITIDPPLADLILTLEIKYTGAVVGPRTLNITVINGEALEVLPYYFDDSITNYLNIVNIVSRIVSVVFYDQFDLDMQFYTVINPVLRSYERTLQSPLIYKYQPFHNFYDNNGTDLNDDRNYNSPFTTTLFNLTERSVIDLKLQPAYDGSVNMVWTDDGNPMRVVNSRFSVDESGTVATLINRRARKDANTYNEINFHQTELIPKAVSIPTLTFNGLVQGGKLTGGGYRYFFKYITADGAETDIIEESRLVSVHDGSTTITASGTSVGETSNAVSFTLSNLDQSFYGVVVYYTKSIGDVDAISTAYKIDAPFIIEDTAVCNILHSGFESTSSINIETLSLTYSLISRAKTLDVVNNRLLVANTDATDVYEEVLAQAAASITIEEGTFDIKHHVELENSTAASDEENYSSPNFIYNKLGYWKGETYELGVVYITEQGLSPVYTLQGIDNESGINSPGNYNTDLFGGLYRGFVKFGQNSMGVYRTHNRFDLWTLDTNKLLFSGTNLIVDTTAIGKIDRNISEVKGFFFVRRARKRDAILQGLLTATAAIPIETKFGPEYEISGFGNWCGTGITSTPAMGNVKFVPAPAGMMPFGTEEVDKGIKNYVPMLDASGAQVTTKTVFTVGGTTVTLSSVDGLSAGNSVKFLGYFTDTVFSVNTGTNVVVLTNPHVTTPGIGGEVQTSTAGSAVSGDFYIKAPIRDYSALKSWALYSPDTECAPTYYASILNGATLGVNCQVQPFTSSDVLVTSGQGSPIDNYTVAYTKITSSLGVPAAFPLDGDKSAAVSYIDTGAVGVAPKGFSGSTDRNFYLYWGLPVGNAGLTGAYIRGKIVAAAAEQFAPGSPLGKPLSYRPGNALAFGRYIGLRLDGYDSGVNRLAGLSQTPTNADTNINAFVSTIVNGWLDPTEDAVAQLGYVANLYNSPTGNILQPEAWKSRYLYDEDSPYVAISERFRYEDYFDTNGDPIGNPKLELYGGDCFLGLSWKQVWHPLGIIEAPQTNDVQAYKTQRRSLGLLPYGYAIPVPAQCNFNFNVRSDERIDEREYKVYGKDRSFLPLKGVNSIRGSRQYETGLYNHGYDYSSASAFKHFRLNLNAPFYRYQYPNRIYVSAEASENAFVNGFGNFKGLNFRDYNSNLGAITKIISLNNVLICVFKDGVAQIGIDERSQVSSDTGGVFVDSAQILSRSNVANSDYGSDHLHSITSSNNFVYGVDFTRLKIWRTNGQALEIISDLKIRNKLGSISKELLDILSGLTVDRWIDVFSHFDSRKNEIYFTFIVRDIDNDVLHNLTRTIVYNETIQKWVCETDDVRKFVFQSGDSRYALPSIVDKYNKIYKYQLITQADVDPSVEVFAEYNKFYDNIYDMYYDYHVTDEPGLYKIYNNQFIIGNNSLPTKVQYTSDHNTLTEQLLQPYTNIRYPMIDVAGDPVLVNAVAGTQYLLLTQTIAKIKATQDNLRYGNFVSIQGPDAHTKYNYVVIEYVPGQYIKVDKIIPINFVAKQLYYGYGSNLPMRLTDSAFEESYGSISCQFMNRTARGFSPTKLRGKWMRFRHTYEGTGPVYINGIITDYGISLS